MPSTNSERSQKAVDVAQQYLRRERPLNALVVVLAWLVFLGTYLVSYPPLKGWACQWTLVLPTRECRTPRQ